MRLTLRTMLAFLDQVLEGPEAAELGQKIEDSKFASDLVHRIRNSVRHVRLGAPKLDGKGMGADANTVASYLDNDMPADQFPEFEKVCLESDVQLAEVAACHQVLTIVLEGPATVDPVTRERMYRIGHPELGPAPARPVGTPVPAGSGNDAGSGNGAANRVDSSPATRREAEDVESAATPEAKGGARRAARPTATTETPPVAEKGTSFVNLMVGAGAALALTFLVTFVALRAIHPFNADHPVWKAIGGGGNASQVADGGSTSVPAGVPAGSESVGEIPPAGAPATEPESAVPVTPSVESTAPAAPGGEAERPMPVAPAAPAEPAESPAAGEMPANPAVPAAGEKGGVEGEVTPAGAPEVPGSSPVRKPVATPTTPVKPMEVGPPVPVARYISEEQILSRLDVEKNSWMVLAPDTSLVAGEQLLSLPTYRPQLVLAPSVKLTLAGEAFLRLRAPDAASVPSVAIDFGRVVLVPVGEMGGELKLDLAGRAVSLGFTDLDSSVALEVRPYLPPGADPRSTTPTVVVQLWVLGGGVQWREGDHAAIPLTAGQKGQFLDESPLVIVAKDAVPDWVEGKNLTDIERRASQELRRFLTTDRPLALSLMEHTTYRQVEVRALACRCLCYMDIFEPAIAALGDGQQRSYWQSQLVAIQATLPFGAATVDKLRADLERVHGADADALWRLLLGYSPEQLASGGAAELVDGLENKSMTIRVLAFLTLHRITEKTQLFRPEERPDQEKSRVTKWRKSLEDGQIVYKTPPAPLPPVPSSAPDEATR